MRVATCAVCGERLNLLREKLVTAEWVDSASGALVAMQFHSPCFVRWYQETASSRTQREAAPEPPVPAPPAPPAPPSPAPPPGTESGPPPEELLSEGERESLRQLRQRRESGSESGGAPGQQPEGDQHGVREDDQAPQHE
jgi:hypothetical protein